MTTDTEVALASAEADVRDAEDLLAALQERVRDGDDTVTPEELEARASLIRFAKLRSEAAHRVAERKNADQRAESYRALGSECRAHVDATDARIVEQFGVALDALRGLWALAEERDTRLRDLRQRAKETMGEAESHGERQLLTDAGLADLPPAGVTVNWSDGQTRTLRHVTAPLVCAHTLSAAMTQWMDSHRAHTGRRASIEPGELQQLTYLTTSVAREWPALDTSER